MPRIELCISGPTCAYWETIQTVSASMTEYTNEAKLLFRAKDKSNGLCGAECRRL